MHWILFTLFAILCWALVNTLDKIIVTHVFKSPLSIIVLEGLIGFCVALIMFISGEVNIPSVSVLIISLVAGGLLYIFNYLYYIALKDSDPTLVSILFQTVPIFTIVWGALFFNEVFTVQVYLGAMLLIIGGLLAINESRIEESHITDKSGLKLALGVMVPANLILSINYALQKYVLSFADYLSVFAMARIGGFIIALFLLTLKTVRSDLQISVKDKNISDWGLLIGIEFLNLLGILFIIKAFALGPVSLVTTLSTIQPLFVSLLAMIVGLVFFKDRKAVSDGLRKNRLFAIIAIAIGVYLISSYTTF